MPDMQAKAQSARPVGRGCLTLFFSLFLAAGIGTFIALVPATFRHAATYTWTRVPCTMVESWIVQTDTVEGGAAGWHVRFAYTVDGVEYVGTRLNVNHVAGDAHDDLRRSQQLAPGTTTTCLVNPRDPTDAVLERQGFGLLLIPLFPLIFVTVGAGGIWGAWRARRPNDDQPLTARVGRRTDGERQGRVVGALFGLVFFGVGVGLTWAFLVRPALNVMAARAWPAVPCEIVSSEVKSHDGDDGTTYSVEITYRYEVEGRAYLSNRYRFMGGSSSGYAGKAAVVARFPPGSQAMCFVNPHDPTDAVMDRGWSRTMWFGLIPIVFALVGGGLLWGIIRSWHSASAQPLRGGAPEGASGPSLRTAAGTWRRAMPVPGATPAPAAGPIELRPSTGRRTKLLGTIIAAVFWNGILSVFLVPLLDEGWTGLDWFLALFLVPFVGVGLFLIGVAIRQVLALSNPVLRLTLAGGALTPGGRLEIAWMLSGRAAAVRHLSITFEGREEATYRRGTDTHTDREVFATFPLADITDPTQLASGRVAIELPRRLIPSFTAPNNKVVWLVRVKGIVPRWPDIDDEYPVHVAAPEEAHHD